MASKTRMAAVAAALVLASHAAAAEPQAIGHVRSDSPVIAAAIQDARQRSATFRGLVASIDASDAYVFVSEGRCGHGVRACFANVRASGTHRFLFIRIDPHKRDCELMASIGHELRHALEVIAEPTIRSDAEKFFFYERAAIHGQSGERETLAAMDAGNAVRSEIDRFNHQAKSE